MRLARVALAIPLALLFVAAPAQSGYWWCYGSPVQVSIGGAAYFTLQHVAGDEVAPLFALHVEANFESGLQRGGASLLGGPDTCQESANPDLLIGEFIW